MTRLPRDRNAQHMKPNQRHENKRKKLLDLLSEVGPENIHEEIDFGQPVGKEIF